MQTANARLMRKIHDFFEEMEGKSVDAIRESTAEERKEYTENVEFSKFALELFVLFTVRKAD